MVFYKTAFAARIFNDVMNASGMIAKFTEGDFPRAGHSGQKLLEGVVKGYSPFVNEFKQRGSDKCFRDAADSNPVRPVDGPFGRHIRSPLEKFDHRGIILPDADHGPGDIILPHDRIDENPDLAFCFNKQ